MKPKKRPYIHSIYGDLFLLQNNPRVIDKEAFDHLCGSIKRDPDFMLAHPIIIDETNTVLGGNQRCKALVAMGYDTVPEGWVRKVAHADGTPFSAEEKRRLVFVDNSPEGISGTFDYSTIMDGATLDLLRDVGIDIAKVPAPEVEQETFDDKAADEVEASPIGEKSEVLKDLDRKRADSLAKFEDMADVGFYSVLVFQSTEQRLAFCKWCADNGVRGKYDARFVNAEDACAAAGIALPECTGAAIRERPPNAVLESMALTQDPEEVDL